MSDRSAATLFRGGGVTGELVRTIDWSKTKLGAPSTWPQSLVAQVRTMLHTRQPTCIFWGPDLVNLYNDAFLPILGEKHPSVMGARAEDCWREAWSIVGPQLLRAKEGECISNDELRVPIARGGRVADAWFNYSYSPLFDDDGAPAGVLVVCTEVTNEVLGRARLQLAHREAELAREELQSIFMQAPLPICILAGPEHRFTLANPPYLELAGREVMGKTLSEAFDADEVAYYAPILDRVYGTGEPVLLREAPMRTANASGRFIDISYHPHRDAQGKIIGVLVVVHDVTARVSIRKQIEGLAVQQATARKLADSMREQAEAASRAKDDFLATVSHELRTPLNSILGWSQILAQPGGHARLERAIDIIGRNARAQAKLIDDILDVSRIISGKLLLSMRPIDVESVVAAAVETMRPAAVAKGVRLRVEIDAKSQWIADEDRLQQVVWNLLSNAVKFTPQGGTVSIAARDEGDRLRIVVRDTGPGISPSFLPYVFDRFRQADASATKRHGGLGLGLAIVRHLVELHGGTVKAESDGDGTGATFEVVLPRQVAETSASSSETNAPRADAPSTDPPLPRASLHGLRVLVVDDQPDARELAAVILEEAGATVVQADGADAAMRALAETDVAAIVSDIGMPGEDGYSLLDRVRASPKTSAIPAVALTAFARAEDRQHALARGFQKHLAKPFEPSQLVAAIASLVRA